VRHRAITIGAGLAMLVLVMAGAAEARNPNCAGGIQYVVQAMRDKEKGNLEDYRREMLKAVDRLTMCSTEDPEDLEALAYLGWACAEMDSACPAGQAFEKAITGLKAKGDKKADWAISNRESYWAKNFNEGVADIQAGQAAYAEFTKEPADDGEKALKAEAANKYAAAIAALGRAACLRPGDARTARNLGTVQALMGDLVLAEATLRAGLVAAPGDSDLISSLGLVRRQYAGKLLDEKKYVEAIGFYEELLKISPDDADLHSGLADAYFKRAFTLEGDARKPDFKSAGDQYDRAARIKAGEADLLFNAGLAYQNAGDFASAETEWRDFLKIKPEDTDAMAALGSTLAELKKYDEAAAVLHQAVNLKPTEKNLHRQLGGVYSRGGNNEASTEEIMLYLALNGGALAENAAEAAKKAPAKSAAATTLATMGAPDEVRYWEGQGQKFETWSYWSKKLAYTFTGGVQVAKTDWGAPPPKLEKPAPAAPAKTAGKKK
jgi:tetratricopeptide (TPR) repeat protein